MSLFDDLSSIAKNALGNSQPKQQSSDDIAGILSSVLSQSQGSGDLMSVLLGSVMGSDSSKNKLIVVLLPIILNWIQKNGGLSGALSKISSLGIDNKVKSWVGQQSNLQLNSNEISKLFDKQDIDQAVQQTGAKECEVCQGLADLLPEVVNKLTPKGNVEDEPQINNEIGQVLTQLSGFFK